MEWPDQFCELASFHSGPKQWVGDHGPCVLTELAEQCVDHVLQMEPNNYQAKQLKELITKD